MNFKGKDCVIHVPQRLAGNLLKAMLVQHDNIRGKISE